MRSHHPHALGLGLLALSACNPPPPSAPVTPPPSAPTSTAAAPAEPDLSPVPVPRGVVAIGRWQNASNTFKAIDRLGRLPISADMLAQKALRETGMEEAIRLDAPAEAAVIIDPASSPDRPKFLGAVSLPLVSLDRALSASSRAGKPVAVRPGVYRLGRTMDAVCDVAASAGDVKARLICSEHERDLDALVPWMTRGLPNEKLGTSDLHLEIRAEGLRQQYQREIDQFAPMLPGLAISELRKLGIQQPGLLDMVSGAANDLPKAVSDADSMAIDLRLDGDKSEVVLGGTIKFKSTSSWMSRLMTGRNDRSGPVPALFWQLPKDSGSASYGHGADPKLFDGVRENLASATRSALTGKVDGADAQAISDLLAKLPLADIPVVVSARGHLDERAPRAFAKPEDFRPADAIKMSQEHARVALGWTVLGFETSADPSIAWAKDLVKTYNSRTLQAKLKKELGPEKAPYLPTVRSVAAPKGSPAGAVALEFALTIASDDVWSQYNKIHHHAPHPKGAPARGQIALTLVIVPDGKNTWIAISGDPAAIGPHLAAAKDGAPKDGTLAARTDLEGLKAGNHTGGGFFTLDALAASVRNSLGRSFSPREQKHFADALTKLPNRGQTPVLVTTDGTTGPSPVNTMEAHITKGTIDDVVTLATIAFMPRSAETDEPPPPPTSRTRPPAKK